MNLSLNHAGASPDHRVRLSERGFTLTELLITITVIAVLLALLGPALGRAKQKAEQAKCLSNQRQLSVAFAAFALDNADQVPPNSSLEGPVASARPPWVSGSSHNRQQHFTNSALLTRPDYAAFAAYIKATAVYKCPSDRFVMKQPEAVGPKARSYSLNSYVDGAPNPLAPGPKVYQFFTRQGDFSLLGPSMLFTFIDVVPENLCHAAFITDMGDDGFFYHLPGRSHGNRGSVSFADGHAETRRWLNPPVTSFNRQSSWGHFYSNQSDMTDHRWIKARTTVLRTM